MWQPFHSCWNVKIKFGGLFTVVRRSKQSVATFSQLLEGRNKLRQFLNEYKVLEILRKKRTIRYRELPTRAIVTLSSINNIKQ